MKKKLSLLVLACMICMVSYGQEKLDVKVLFVGYSKDKPIPEGKKNSYGMVPSGIAGGMDYERMKNEYGNRMTSFQDLLETYFASVTTVDARDYKEEMSNDYDVTIFDQVPSVIKGRVLEEDPETGDVTKYEPPQYLTANYDRPTIFIGHTSDMIGRSLGTKLDWYCLCLDKYAHHVKTEHPIFSTPLPTSITLESRATPDGALKSYDGENLGEQILMWQVDKEGYGDGKGFRVGMVARGWGFEDSPDAEVISGGLSTKQKTAVALGRHGNFFLWGFAGSPEYMTEEAKKVFINVVAYTHEHADDKIIARKYNDRIATKSFLKELLYHASVKGYQSWVDFSEKGFAEGRMKIQAALKKQEVGEELTKEEEMYVKWDGQQDSWKVETREQFLKDRTKTVKWTEITGLDPDAIVKYIHNNWDYFYSEPSGFYDLKVDEDIKSLGVANTDIRMLDKAISLLEKGEEKAKANRILMRYTLESFSSPKDWRAWFEKHKGNMFFTQSGGFVWMINDADANPKIKPRNEKDIVGYEG